MSKIKTYFTKQINFYKFDIWKLSPEEEKRLFIINRVIKLLWVGWKQFNNERCSEKASALTFYTLLSVVPVFAMIFGVAKGFGFERLLEQMLLQKFADKKEILLQVFKFANSLLAHTHGGMIAGIGIVILLWSVMKVLGNVEAVLNDIWEVKSNRTNARKLSDYFSIMLLAPIMLIVSNSATIYITHLMHGLTFKIAWLHHYAGILSFLFKLIPFSLVWIGFAMIYLIMPNTKVTFKSAITGGILAGIIFQIVQEIYFKFQIGVASYNAIYGSFAAVPLFLVWLQLSWFIVILGAVISHVAQNGYEFGFDKDDILMSHEQKLALSLWLVHIITINFENGEKPIEIRDLAQKTKVSHYLIKNILNRLEKAKVVIRIFTSNREEFYFQPAVSTAVLTVQYLEQAIDLLGEHTLVQVQASEYKRIEELLHDRRITLVNSSINKPIKDL